ncbi:hypothetical protein B0T24DRAFT_712184 [Lasiosphaeria ovina]|uniref:Uncharacterized protein n=1 Tax=Lasiosphaeria ovina TaxID=92902 RepID=A0AAE0JVK6_9PEZI|nr:hypothetical protein B0T24DRAFT_712184 [Lasiosphaeria ovina]
MNIAHDVGLLAEQRAVKMDIAHDVGLPAEQLNMLTAIAAPFFVDRIADALRTPKASGAWDFCRIVRETALSRMWTDHRNLEQHPASMREFLSMASSIFSEQYLEHLAARATHFNAISGFTAISHYFISYRPAIDSISDVIRAIVVHSATELSREAIIQELSTTTGGTEVTQVQQQPPSPLLETIQPGQQSSSSRLPIGSGEADIPCRIQQIDLEGPTISEAWRVNTTTNAMENLALSVGSNADPLSMAFRALPVYHGTDWKVEDNEGARVPTRTYKAKLESSWNCPLFTPGSGPSSHNHSGVTLFKFRPSLPSASGQTYYLIPRGREAEWESIFKAYNTGDHSPPSWEGNVVTKHLWDQFSTIHGGVLDTWPNTLHCYEFGPQLNLLRSYTRQLWRTVWFEAGVGALLDSYEVTYAISFKLAAPVPPQVSSRKEEKSRFK